MINTDGKRTVAHRPASSSRCETTPSDPAAVTVANYADLLPAQARMRAEAANKIAREAEAFLKGQPR